MTAESLRHRYIELLAAYGVDAESEDDLILLSGEADAGHCPGVLECRDLETGDAVKGEKAAAVLVEITYTLPFDPAPPDRLAELALLLACLNPEVGLGHFELEPLTRRIGFRAAQMHAAGASDGLLMAPLLEGLNVIDDHAESLRAVLDGDAAGQVYVAAVLAERDAMADDPDPDGDEPPMTDEMRAALLAWLDRAGETYRQRADKARQAALAPLIRRLFAG